MSEESAALLNALNPSDVAGLDVDIRYLGGNLRETLAHYRLLFPELVAYRGGLFIESQFDKRTVDDIFDQSQFDVGDLPVATAEQNVNAISLLAEDDARDFDAPLARANAEAIGWVWKRWIRETYGVEVDVVISVSDPEDCHVWFLSRSDPDATS